MALNLNHVQLAGHLTRDPQVRALGERSVAAFGLAINRRFKTAEGEPKDETTFIDCEAWGRTGELVGQYLTKGSPCFLEGRLKLDQWDDKDGTKRSKLKVVVDNVQFLGRAKEREGAGHADAAGEPSIHAPAAARAPELAGAARGKTQGNDEPPF